MDAVAAQSTIPYGMVRGRKRKRGDIDGRTTPMRRVAMLARSYAEGLSADELTPTVMAKIRRAAELVVAAETLRTRAMRGEITTEVGLLSLVRLEGIADRAVRRLHAIKREPGNLELRPIPTRFAP
jgi:hypothetical protein